MDARESCVGVCQSSSTCVTLEATGLAGCIVSCGAVRCTHLRWLVVISWGGAVSQVPASGVNVQTVQKGDSCILTAHDRTEGCAIASF